MGNHDQNYKGDNQVQPAAKLRRISSRRSGDPTPRQVVVAVGQMLVTFVAILASLRLPTPPIVKLLLVGVLLVIGARWIIRSYQRSKSPLSPDTFR